MSEKIIVEIFGISDQASAGSANCVCGCSGGCCGPSKTMREYYDEFARFLTRSRL